VTTFEVPELLSDRLRLRGHTLDDFEACAALWGDPVVTRHIGGRPSARDEVWSRLLRYVGHWALLGYGFWLIEERESGAFVGEIGFADFKRGLSPEFDAHREMGWALAPSAHGKGYASEAAAACLAWGDAQFSKATIVCMIDPENAPSIRVAQKAGFTEFARADFRGGTTVLFRRG